MAHKRNAQAVRIHDEQARLFETRYEVLERDPYWDTFAYSRKKIQEVLDRYVASPVPGRHLLDVGCGTGSHLKKWREQGFVCAGCDPSEEMLARAREGNPGVRLDRAAAESLPYDADLFDAVTCIEVMRYLPRPDEALAEIHRVLRPGAVSVATYAPKLATNLYPLINQLTGRVRVGRLSKVRQYFHTAGELERAYARLGFVEVEVHARFFGPFLFVSRLHRRFGSRLLRAWEPTDDVLARHRAIRNFANLFVVTARKRSEGDGTTR
jgi:ubiquinone/menaquinone biosynthesis C-methylase UbiE